MVSANAEMIEKTSSCNGSEFILDDEQSSLWTIYQIQISKAH